MKALWQLRMVFVVLLSSGLLQAMKEDDNEFSDKHKKRKNKASMTVPKKSKKNDDVETIMRKACAHIQKKEYAQAIIVFEKLLKDDNLSFDYKVHCWMNLGFAYQQTQKNDLAITMFENVLNSTFSQQTAEIARVRFLLGKLLLEKDIERALSLFKKCAKQNFDIKIANHAIELLCSFYKKTNNKKEGLILAHELIKNKDLEFCFMGHYYYVFFKDFKSERLHLKALEAAVSIFNKLSKHAQAKYFDGYNDIVNSIMKLKYPSKSRNEEDLESSSE